MKRYLLIIILSSIHILASNEADNWFFGDYCGIRFQGKDKHPVFLTGSQMSTVEGCATISDISGNLLFYTDGSTIWNKSHVQMPNGNDLLGHQSSTQSAVVVQKPGSDHLFYVFTVDRQAAPNGMKYSIVDMRLDAGRGDVIIKNIDMYNPVTEKITAVKHSNGKDIWVIAHEWDNNTFLAYLLTDTGLVNKPVLSNTGSNHSGDSFNTAGYMKASPDGKYIGLCIYEAGIVEILKFNNSSGELSAPITFDSLDYSTCYGVEFSPDGSKFYFSVSREISRIYQIDMMAGSEMDILKSITIVAEYPLPYYYQALQFAPDGKIYVAKRDKSYLSCIIQPNLKGSACSFIENAFDLKGRKCRQGLPSFNQSYQEIYLNIEGPKVICEGETLILKAVVSDSVSYSWSGPENFSSTDSVIKIEKIRKSQQGYYKVTVTVGSLSKTDSVNVIVESKPIASIIPKDSAYLCKGSFINLSVSNVKPDETITWSTGENTQMISISTPGTYSLILRNSMGCVDTAFIKVIERAIPTVNIKINGPERLCKGEKVELFPDRQFSSYSWSTGETNERIIVSQPGNYVLTIVDEFGCSASDTITIGEYDLTVIAPTDYDFGEILTGTTKTKKFEYINKSSDSIYISSISRIFNTSVFDFVVSTSLPVWLKTNEKIIIDVTFAPDAINAYLDTVQIIAAFPCNIFSSFQIKGLSGSDLTLISIPDTTAKIGQRFKIPVYSKMFSSNEYKVAYKMGISFDANIFVPKDNQTNISRNIINAGRRYIEIESSEVTVNNKKNIIFELDGTVMLSSGKHTIKIEYFQWQNPDIKVDTISGSLVAFGVCRPDLSDIKILNPINLTIIPNPANSIISVSISPNLAENNITAIRIVDISGIVLEERHYDGNSTSQTFNIGKFPDGILLVEVWTHGSKISQKIMKLH